MPKLALQDSTKDKTNPNHCIINLMNITLLRLVFIITILSQLSTAKELEKVSLQFQWLDQFQFAGYYIAKEKGYYRDSGLEVEFKKYDFKTDIVADILNKKTDYGVGRSSLIIDKSKGKDIKILSAIFQSSPLVLIALKDSNINQIKDFIAKRVMITSDAQRSVSLHAMINHERVNSKELIEQQHSFNIQDLINKKTDLMASYISNEPFLLKQKGIAYNIFDPKDYGFDFYSDVLFTSDDEIQENPQRANNFKDASIKGWMYAFDNIDETVELILAKYNTQNKSKEALIFEANELKKLAYYQIDELGHISASKVQRIYDIYNVMGFVKNPINIDEFIFHDDIYRSLSLTQEEKLYLKNKKELTVCVKKDWLPFEDIERGKFIGISADLLALYASKLNISLKIIPTQSQVESMQLFSTKACDIKPIVGVGTKLKIPYKATHYQISDNIALITRIEQPFINDLHNLNETVLMVKGYKAFLNYIKEEYPLLKIKIVNDVNTALELVADSKAYGYVGMSLTASYKIQKQFSAKLKIINNFKELKKGIGVRDDEPILLSILNKTIDDTSKIEKREIFNRWIATTVEKDKDYTLIYQVLGFIVLLLLIFIYKALLSQKYAKELEKRVQVEIEKNRVKEQQLLQQSRLAQMGEMISMIAHQWRQPLSAISATSNNLRIQLELGLFDFDTKEGIYETQEYFLNKLRNVDKYVTTLSSTIDDFRDFYKPNKMSILTTLEKVIEKSLELIKSSLISQNVTIIKKFDYNQEIEIYDNELMHVILNLIKNAQDNFKEKKIQEPTITLSTGNQTISICDNGGGVPENIIDNIFDPYFSTKDEKNGTGLGLYMSKMIIENHHKGQLSVQNIDDGACFSIILKHTLNQKYRER